jgi:D-alanine-D-alanine ligase-like ATP-grasp enzyme
MKLAIVTSPEHSYLGWGTKTESVKEVANVLRQADIEVSIINVSNNVDLQRETDTIASADLVWPNVYHYDNNGIIDSLPKALEGIGARLVGPTSKSLETVLLKDQCQAELLRSGVPVPRFVSINGESISDISKLLSKANLTYPIIVKSAEGSISSGILPDSVKEIPSEVPRYVEQLRDAVNPRRILLEEYIDGPEFTVAVIGNGEKQRTYAVNTQIVDPITAARKYVFMDGNMRPGCLKKGLVRLEPITDEVLLEKLADVAQQTCQALEIYDWTRFDGRLDSEGTPRIFDVNGMPGLSMDVSVTTHQFSSLYPNQTKEESMKGLVYSIAHSAAMRHGIEPTKELEKGALYLR